MHAAYVRPGGVAQTCRLAYLMILRIYCPFSQRIDEIVGITFRKSYLKQRLVDIGVVLYPML